MEAAGQGARSATLKMALGSLGGGAPLFQRPVWGSKQADPTQPLLLHPKELFPCPRKGQRLPRSSARGSPRSAAPEPHSAWLLCRCRSCARKAGCGSPALRIGCCCGANTMLTLCGAGLDRDPVAPRRGAPENRDWGTAWLVEQTGARFAKGRTGGELQ